MVEVLEMLGYKERGGGKRVEGREGEKEREKRMEFKNPKSLFVVQG